MLNTPINPMGSSPNFGAPFCGACRAAAQPSPDQALALLSALISSFLSGAMASSFGQGAALPSATSFGGSSCGLDPGLSPFLGSGPASTASYPTATQGSSSGEGQGAAAVDWAESQLGVSESANPDVVRGYSNGADQSWCADFVSTALEQTGGSPFGHQSSVQGILDWGQRNGCFIPDSQAAANPGCLQEGDIAVWKEDGRSHVGLVSGVNPDGTFSTIEGNTSDQVARRTHRFDERGLTGFVRARG